MTDISGYHHVTLTVSDVERSAAWYEQVLGLEVFRRVQQDELSKALLRHPTSGLFLVLVAHGEHAVVGPFSERRCGLDHVGFAVADRASLERWKERLDAAGVERSDVIQGSSGELVAFRDPDNIALEVYTLT